VCVREELWTVVHRSSSPFMLSNTDTRASHLPISSRLRSSLESTKVPYRLGRSLPHVPAKYSKRLREMYIRSEIKNFLDHVWPCNMSDGLAHGRRNADEVVAIGPESWRYAATGRHDECTKATRLGYAIGPNRDRRRERQMASWCRMCMACCLLASVWLRRWCISGRKAGHWRSHSGIRTCLRS
jgi:hypothetical protein